MRSWWPVLPCWSAGRTQGADCRWAGPRGSRHRTTRPAADGCRNEFQRNAGISICRVSCLHALSVSRDRSTSTVAHECVAFELFHVIATIVLRQTAHGPIPLVPRYDGHEREWTAPMPYLFQRQIGGVRRVASPATILNNLRKRCQIIGETNPAFRGLHFTAHDFRRLFATDLVNNGLPIHIGAALLGHLSIGTTQGYVAVFEGDVIRHVQDFLARRRAMRPEEEYRPVTEEEWQEFEEHFDKRKVELGSCGRPYGTSCQHEHACLRCAQLHVNPKMLPRLDELESDLEERRKRATAEGWLGEIEGVDLTLQCLRDKRADALRLTRITRQVDLGMPAVGAAQ